MRPSTVLRLVAVAVIALALVASGCRRGDNEAEESPTPEATEGVERSDEFQLVGRAEHAFLGTTPGVDVSDDLTLPPAVQGTATAPEPGVLRVLLSDVSVSLRDKCQADADDRIEVFWTTQTRFDPVMLRGDIEETLDGRMIGAIGTIFIAPDVTDDDFDFGSPAVTGSPAATGTPGATPLVTGEINERCVLVADQMGTTATLPTSRPRGTATPTPTVTPTATPSPTPTPTKSPPSPSPSPSPSASATASPTAT
jgi:cell division septation protein DedD